MASESANFLGKMFQKPKCSIDGKKGEILTCIPSPYEIVFISRCSDSKVTVGGACAKCIIENCENVSVDFEERIVSGSMELINSCGVTVTIVKGHKVPTVSLDSCHNVHLHFQEPHGMGSMYTAKCNDIFVNFQPPYLQEQKLTLPSADTNSQYITRCSVGKVFSVMAVREGAGYLTTQKDHDNAEKRAAEMEKRVEEHVRKLVQSSMGKTTQQQPVTKAVEPQATPSQKTESQAKPNQQTESQVKPSQQTESQAEPSQQIESQTSKDVEGVAEMLLKAKGKLKPTETVVRPYPVVDVGGEGKDRGRQYNIEDEQAKMEFFDDAKQLDSNVKQVVKWLRESKHAIIFTGAGVSTSAGIPDFRSGMDTVLPTGPGVWELRASDSVRTNKHLVPILKALPTKTHMSIVRLHDAGLCKFTVSQNVDGLHRRSGLSPANLAELHGNTNLETCKKCSRQYLRDFETREAMHVFDHTTSRVCDDPSCRGTLQDSIINFGENLPVDELTKAFDHAKKADLCIVLGSSLRVRPACQVPEVVIGNGGRVVICNLQKIPQFPPNRQTMNIFAMCDNFMEKLLEELEMEVPRFLLRRRVKVSSEKKSGKLHLIVTGVDISEDVPYSFLKSVDVSGSSKPLSSRIEPFSFELPGATTSVSLMLNFHGHYREPSLSVSYSAEQGLCHYWLEYDPSCGQWHTLVKSNQ